jgi:AMP nucleosidase
MVPDGVKTEALDQSVTKKYVDLHLDIGIEAMTHIADQGESIKHFSF